MPLISVIVITKDDPDVVLTVDAVLEQIVALPQDAELVVVDASRDRVALPTRNGVAARLIEYQPTSHKPSIPEQRNVAVHAATGEIIVFIDSGCIPSDRWLPKLIQPILDGAESLVAGSHRSSHVTSIRDRDHELRRSNTYLREAPTINLALRRSLLDEVGGFDERFGYGSDVDLTWRLSDRGYRIRYLPEAAVSHDWGGLKTDLRRTRIYGRARAQLYLKHRSRRILVWRQDPVAILYPAYIVLLVVGRFRRGLLALVLIPLAKNRGHHPLLTTVHNFVFGVGVLEGLLRAHSPSR